MLAADLLHRTIAAQPGEHDLDLLPRRPAPVLALLAQPCLLVSRAAHAEPAAGQSLQPPVGRGWAGLAWGASPFPSRCCPLVAKTRTGFRLPWRRSAPTISSSRRIFSRTSEGRTKGVVLATSEQCQAMTASLRATAT